MKSLLMALTVSLLTHGTASAQIFEWTSNSSGNWSLNANWNPSAPPDGGGNNVLLNFGGFSSYTANNNLVGTFQLNALFFNSFTGTTTINGNALEFVNFGGAAPIIKSSFSNALIANSVSLANTSPLMVDLGFNSSLAFSGILTGSGGLRTSGSGNLSFNGNAAYTGSTVLGNATTTLSGNGAFTATSALTVLGSSRLVLDNTSANINRLGDALAVSLQGGRLDLIGNASMPTTEAIGSLTTNGFSRVSIAPAAQTTLTSTNLARIGRSTLQVSGANFGGSGPGSSQLIFDTSLAPDLIGGGGAAGSTTISILPYVVHDTGLTTYGPTGVRALAAGEYATSLSFPIPGTTTNVRLTNFGEFLSTPGTVNALVLDNGQVFGNPLTVTSGTVIAIGSSPFTTNYLGMPINFGAAEGQIFSLNTVFIDGVLSGSNGVTFSGAGLRYLYGRNTYTGVTRINGGRTFLQNADAFGSDPSAIQIVTQSSQDTFLQTTGGVGLDFTRNLDLQGTGVLNIFNSSFNTSFKLSGVISGGPNAGLSATSTLVLTNPANIYSGPTRIDNGTLVVTSGAVLGNTSRIEFNGGTLRLAGNFTTAVPVNYESFGTIDTNGFDATITGNFGTPSGNSVALTKLGLGDLTFTAGNDFPAYRGVLNVLRGRVVLSGNGSLTTVNAFSSNGVNEGAEVVLDNSTVALPDRFNPEGSFNFSHGGLTLIGHPTIAVEQEIRSLGFFNEVNRLSVNAAGGAATALRVTSSFSQEPTTALLIRGTTLGAPPGPGVGSVFASATLIGGNSFGPLVSVLAGSLGDTSATGLGSSVITKDSTVGFRPLFIGEYSNSLVSGANAFANILLTAPASLNGNTTTVTNTLTLIGGVSVTGNDSLEVNAGVVLATGPGASIATAELAFARTSAGNEAHATGVVAASSGADLTISSPIVFKLNSFFNDTMLAKMGAGTVTLTGPISATSLFGNPGLATVHVDGGTLRIGSTASGFTPREVRVSSGATLEFLSGISRSIPNLNGDGTVLIPGATLTLTGSTLFGGNIAAAGGVDHRGSTQFRGTNDYTGSTTVSRNAFVLVTDAGAFANSAFVGISGVLNLENEAAITNRLGNSSTLAFAGGSLTLTGNDLANVVEAVGTIEINNGNSFLNLYTGAGTLTALSAGTLTRPARGTANVFAPLFGEVAGPNIAQVRFTTAPTLVGTGTIGTPTAPVLPYVFIGGRRATYEAATGLRALKESEQSFLTVGLNPETNSLLFDSINLTSPTSVGSLQIQSFDMQIMGSNTLNVTRGLVVVDGGLNSASFNVPIDFGSLEGVFFVEIGTILNANNPISGSGGITKTAGGALGLFASNTYSGPTTLNEGFLYFSGNVASGAASPFGNSTTPIALSGGTLAATGAPTFFNRDLVVTAGFGRTDVIGATLDASAITSTLALNGSLTLNRSLEVLGPVAPGNSLVFAGTLGGPGGLEVGSGQVSFPNASSFNGVTRLRGGTFTFVGNNASFGTGPIFLAQGNGQAITVEPTGGFRTLANPVGAENSELPLRLVTTSFGIEFTGGFALGNNGLRVDVTGPNAATISGTISGTNFGNRLIKAGRGTLQLTAVNDLASEVRVEQGELRLVGLGSIANVTQIGISEGRLVLNPSSATAQLSPFAEIQLGSGELALMGRVGGDTVQDFGFLFATTAPLGDFRTVAGTVTLQPTGDGVTVLRGIEFLYDTSAAVLVRGTNLGSPAGPNVGQLRFTTILPNLIGGFGSGTPDTSVLAGFIASTSATGTGDTIVTYDAAVGVRPLASSEYAPSFTVGTDSFDNVRATAPLPAVTLPTTVNSLTLDAGSTLTGSDTLTVSSGLLVASGGGTRTAAVTTLNLTTLFNSATPAIIAAASGTALTINANLVGFNRLATYGNITLNTSLDTVDTALAPFFAFQGLAVGTGTLTLNASNSLSQGSANVNPGSMLVLNGVDHGFTTVFGAGTYLVNGGTLRVTECQANSETGSDGNRFNGLITGTGGFTVDRGACILFTAPQTYTGPTNIFNKGRLTLTGLENGSILASPVVNVAGTLRLDNRDSSVNRLGDTTAVTLTGGTLEILSQPSMEVIGSLTIGAGESTIFLETAAAQIQTTTFTRANAGTLQTSQPFEAAAGSVLVSGTPPTLFGVGSLGTTSAPILPWAYGTREEMFSNRNQIPATYEPGVGLRPLLTSEYAEFAVGTATTQNVIARGFIDFNVPSTVQSFTVNTSNVTGNAPVTTTSGVLINNNPITLNSPINFGAGEAVVIVASAFSFAPNNTLTLAAPLTIASGLTKGGSGKLILSATSNISGTTHVNLGKLVVNGSLTGNGGVVVRANATLGGIGTLSGPVVIDRDAIIAPTEDLQQFSTSARTLNINGNLTINGTYRTRLNPAGFTNTKDQLIVVGNLVLGSNSILQLEQFFNSGNPVEEYTLISFTGSRTGVFGSTANIPQFPAEYFLDYRPNSIVLTTVPVPEPLLLLALGFGVLLIRRRF